MPQQGLHLSRLSGIRFSKR